MTSPDFVPGHLPTLSHRAAFARAVTRAIEMGLARIPTPRTCAGMTPDQIDAIYRTSIAEGGLSVPGRSAEGEDSPRQEMHRDREALADWLVRHGAKPTRVRGTECNIMGAGKSSGPARRRSLSRRRVVGYLVRHPEATPNEIARAIRMCPTTVKRVLEEIAGSQSRSQEVTESQSHGVSHFVTS